MKIFTLGLALKIVSVAFMAVSISTEFWSETILPVGNSLAKQ